MGQKVNPHGARVGVIYDWSTRWYAGKKDFANYIVEDYKLRNMLKKDYYDCAVSKIDIERTASRMKVTMFVARPGVVLGRAGKGIEECTAKVEKFLGHPCMINVVDISKQADADAQLVAENIAQQLEKRIAFRRAMKSAIQRAMKNGAKGVKVAIGGRIGGADIARTEHYHEGSIPLQTLRANIDYGFAEAKTTYGRLGVKVWVYKGQVLPKAKKAAATEGGK